jgi:hypothetical protein
LSRRVAGYVVYSICLVSMLATLPSVAFAASTNNRQTSDATTHPSIISEAKLPTDAAADPQVTLPSISCAPYGGCAAVGTYRTVNGGLRPLVLSGYGTRWAASSPPVPTNANLLPDARLLAVACNLNADCVAVGSYRDGGRQQEGLVLWRSGSRWEPFEPPLPGTAAGQPNVSLTSAACESTGACAIVGTYVDGHGTLRRMLVWGSGSRWGSTPSPLPANAAPGNKETLSSVSCGGSGCTATGTYIDSNGVRQGLVLAGHGSAWQATEAPLPDPAPHFPLPLMQSTACAGGTQCVVAGRYYDKKGDQKALIMYGSGTAWHALIAPSPRNVALTYSYPVLEGVSCQGTSECTAVGKYNDNRGDAEGLISSGFGPSWVSVQAPLPPNAATNPGTKLTAIACQPAGGCLAIGSYSSSSGQRWAMVAGAKSSWSAAAAGVPADAASRPNLQLSSVACAGKAGCVVAGTYTAVGGRREGILEAVGGIL